MPSLINIEDINIIIIMFLIGLIFHNLDDDIKSTLDPSAWARKYFSIASVSWNLFDMFISGINANMLISRAVHVINQLFLDKAIIVLIIIMQ